ncbi:MAG: Hsp33 family molecular chaperone HslO [Acetobacteraceae bacterium]|nr:Hsp33 family molecular chaperone HslO [Acetobacteraceae bacterium]
MTCRPDIPVGAAPGACGPERPPEHTREYPPERPPVPDLTVDDAVQPFWLRGAPARGRLVRLGPLAQAILGRHADNPPQVNAILGEALALTAGLAAALKYRGSFSLQARGDGALPMLLADCTDDGALRGYARFDEAKLALLGAEPSATRLLGAGYLAFSCETAPEGGGAESDRYQGIVPLEGATLAEITHTYFRTSEQTETAVRTFARVRPEGWRAGALILERVAISGGADAPGAETAEDAWREAVAFASTLTEAEMLDGSLPPRTLLHRLFFDLAPAFAAPRALSYGCRCTRARLAAILAGFSADDLDHMAAPDAATGAGRITMTCEFCNHAFHFPRDAFNA